MRAYGKLNSLVYNKKEGLAVPGSKNIKVGFILFVLIFIPFTKKFLSRNTNYFIPRTEKYVTDEDTLLSMKKDFANLDSAIRTWWDQDLHTAVEKDICVSKKELLYLPFPYSSAGGSENSFPNMYGWDTYFINMAMLEHGRTDLVKNHILNHLFMIEKFGYVLNANHKLLKTRSQPPLLASSIIAYFNATSDTSMLMMAFPLLEKEYNGYWCAEHHRTPIGITTCRDLGDPGLRNELASEAETGLDFDALYNGNVTECVPLHVNCILVQYEQALSQIAKILGLNKKAIVYSKKSIDRSERIQKYCWNEKDGFFYEYNYVKKEQIKIRSLCAYWTIWSGVATKKQTEVLVKNLSFFEHTYGLAFTSEDYPSPHKEFKWLQWGFPSGWPPMHVIIDKALRQSNNAMVADRITQKYLSMVFRLFNTTGKLWERYNVIDGSIDLPTEREGYGINPMHGWSAAAVVILGNALFLRN